MAYAVAMSHLLVLVGHLPATKRGASLKRTLAGALGGCPYTEVRFADDVEPGRVRSGIGDAFLCLFETSRGKDARALLELGYAQGRGRHSVVLHGKRPQAVSGFGADREVAYGSLRELRSIVRDGFVGWLGEAFHHYTREGRSARNVDTSLLAPLASSLLERDLEDEYTEGCGLGFSEEQVDMTMTALVELGMARATDAGWTVTDLGRAHLPRLIGPMRRPQAVLT